MNYSLDFCGEGAFDFASQNACISALFRARVALSMRKINAARVSNDSGGKVLYIVAVGWLYVVLMMAITERSLAAGLGTFFFYGVVPLAVVLYLLATPSRRRAARARELAQLEALRSAQAQPDAMPAPAANSSLDPDDRAHVIDDPLVAPERIKPL
jgi:hypothetical protein